MHPNYPSSPAIHQRGISLVEIMIAMTLGLLVTAAIVQVYMGSRQNQTLQESLATRQEAARFAAQAIEHDAKMAGFRGCLRDTGDPRVVNNRLGVPNDFFYNFTQFATGFDTAPGAAGWNPGLPASIAEVNPLPGSDVLTLRAASEAGGMFLTANMASSTSPLTVRDDLPDFPVGEGDILVLSDCGGAAIFQVSGVDPGAGTIEHEADTGVAPGNVDGDLQRRFDAGAQLFRVRTTTYFVALSATGNGPALWRRDGNAPAVELAAGVENMQVLYGEDTDGNRAPDNYQAADAVGDWANVVSIRVALLVSGARDNVVEKVDEDAALREFDLLGETLDEPRDGRLRRVVTLTVALRNRLS